MLSGTSNVTNLSEARVHMWGGMKDVGDVSWHKVNIYSIADSTSSRRVTTFKTRFWDASGTLNAHYDLAVFTPQSNASGSAGGGVGCPGTGTVQNDVFGNAYLNSGSASDKEELCTRHASASWHSTWASGVDKWEFGDRYTNAGYAGGAGHSNTRFTSSPRAFFSMSSGDAVDHPYPGTYSGSDSEQYVMLRVIKVSGGGTCHPYQLMADADTNEPYED